MSDYGRWRRAMSSLEDLIYKKPRHVLWEKRTWLMTLQNALDILTNTQSVAKTEKERKPAYKAEMRAVVQKLREFVIEHQIGGADSNAATISRAKIVEIVYNHLKTILPPAASTRSISPPSSVLSSPGSTPIPLPSLPALPTSSPTPSIGAPPAFTPLFAASPAIALEASTNLVAAFFSASGGAVPMLPAQCFTMEQHAILQGCLPMESYRKLFFSIPISSQIQ